MVRPMDIPDLDPTPAAPDGGERIAKRLARAGLCSRRDAERWIAEGRVAVNGETLTGPACVVRSGDIVQVDGKVIPEPEPARLWRYYKPSGLVTSARDEKGRATVFDRLPPELPRVVSIGRLDLTTEGLLLLTNDGELARFLELPATGWTRRYRVRVFGEVDEVKLAALAKGPTIEGVKYGPIEAALDRIQGRNAWLTVSLKEGKNREIRKVMEALGLQVNRLIRVAYGPFQLGKLEEGAVEEVPKRVVREQVANFFDGGTATAEPEASNTKLRAKARAEAGTPAPGKPAAKTETAAKPMLKSSPGTTPKRVPRSATKRLEAQAAWGKDEAKPAAGKAPRGRFAPAGEKSGGEKSGGEKTARARSTLSLGDPAAKPGRGGGKPETRPETRDAPGPRPRGSKPSAPGKPAALAKTAAVSKPASAKLASAKPASSKPVSSKSAPAKPAQTKSAAAAPAAPAGPKKRDGRLDRQRVDRPRADRRR